MMKTRKCWIKNKEMRNTSVISASVKLKTLKSNDKTVAEFRELSLKGERIDGVLR
jgi:hypothetical protein